MLVEIANEYRKCQLGTSFRRTDRLAARMATTGPTDFTDTLLDLEITLQQRTRRWVSASSIYTPSGPPLSLNLSILCLINTLDHNYELFHHLHHLLKQTTVLKTDTQATRAAVD